MYNLAEQIHALWITEDGFAIMNDLCDKDRRAGNIITTKTHLQIIQGHVGHASSVTITGNGRERHVIDVTYNDGVLRGFDPDFPRNLSKTLTVD